MDGDGSSVIVIQLLSETESETATEVAFYSAPVECGPP